MPSARFYLSVPNADGVFMGDKLSEHFEKFISLYEFEPFKNYPDRAFFHLAPEAVEWALEDVENRVEPVCESTNNRDEKTCSIKIIGPGIAELLNVSGNWKMDKKSKIEYVEDNSNASAELLRRLIEEKAKIEAEAITKIAEMKKMVEKEREEKEELKRELAEKTRELETIKKMQTQQVQIPQTTESNRKKQNLLGKVFNRLS